MDLFSRKIIAYTISRTHNAKMVSNTFKKAYNIRNNPKGLMFHSDQGSEYTSKTFRRLLDNLGLSVNSYCKRRRNKV